MIPKDSTGLEPTNNVVEVITPKYHKNPIGIEPNGHLVLVPILMQQTSSDTKIDTGQRKFLKQLDCLQSIEDYQFSLWITKVIHLLTFST